MKAIRIYSRGGPERLVYEEAPKATPGPGDALVRVFASAITKDELTWDATYQTSDGRSRLPSIPGHEFSGVVEAITSGASDVKVGESVYALASFYRDGSAAEYIAVQAADLAPKPRTLTYEQSASVPLAALTAWQALFEHAGLTGGRRVLIHGAAGGVGTFAVQLARLEGAHVIATASAKNEEFVRQLGANEIIDYQRARFEDRVRDVDVVLDTIGGDTLERSWGVLVRGGVLISIVENPSPPKAATLLARSCCASPGKLPQSPDVRRSTKHVGHHDVFFVSTCQQAEMSLRKSWSLINPAAVASQLLVKSSARTCSTVQVRTNLLLRCRPAT
jgi:NADPH:quinone reductase-like Zn-dependent oxidoreductase